MKTLKLNYLLVTGLLLFVLKIHAQSDVAGIGPIGHTGIPGYYVGWNAATASPLNIRHNGNFPINFFTNNIQKATITNNFSLGTTTIIPGVGTGDGLRITPRTSGCGIPSTPDASLDLWANDGKNRSYLTKSRRNTGMKFRSISLYCISNSSHETNFHNTPFVPL